MHGQVINDRYRIDKAIGRGGMALVYKAYDAVLDRPVAIKVLHGHFTNNAHFIERFKREAYAAASLLHPNITTIYDTGCSNGAYFIVMEYVSGKTLKQIIESRAPLPITETVDIIRQIAEALGHAHSRGIIHRDIKPQNILITEDAMVKVSDFGIARALTMPGLTQTGKILGTARYISPEQARGHQADQRSDIYSLGVILYEMVTGRPLFEGASSVEVASKHVTEKPVNAHDINPDVPQVLEIVIDKLLKKNPSDRYQDIAKVLEDLSFWEPLETAELKLSSAQSESKLRSRRGRKSGARAHTRRGKHKPVPREARSARSERTAPAKRKKLTPFAKVLITLCFFIIVGAISHTIFSGFAGSKAVPKTQNHGRAKAALSHVAGEQVGVLKPVEAVDYDPAGDGDENPDDVGKVTDGKPETSWSTENYKSATFSDPDGGVGVYIDYGKAVALREMTINSSGGWTGVLKGSNDVLTWESISGIKNANKELSIKTEGKRYRYYLIWFTKLPNLGGAYKCKVFEVAARGRMF